MKKKGGRKLSDSGLTHKLDDIFSKIVRLHGKCEHCGKTENLQTSHIYSRANRSVRWDFLNVNCFCAGCHLYWWHKYQVEALDWLRAYYGPKKMAELKKRAESIKKWTRKGKQELLETLTAAYNEMTHQL